MKWIKKGLIFSDLNASEYGLSNYQVPYAIYLKDKIRIFYGARHNDNRSAKIYYLDVDSKDPKNILYINTKPILDCGITGTFDQDGVLPVCVINVGSAIYMYYGGFSRLETSSHTCMMGLAISKDGGESFIRISEGPIFPISRIDPYLIGSADIVYDKDLWHMIYTSGTKWTRIRGSLEISYLLKYAYSKDGIDWVPTSLIAIPPEIETDAFAKPAIIKMNNSFIMYFSKRKIINYRKRGKSAYSLGFATSEDLMNWTRDDKKRGLEVSSNGWDSEMICYPNIIKVEERYFMFYNGNGFGKSGFGYAELEF